MLPLSMIPTWDGIHPLLIQFPLTLFFLAPVFVLFAGLTKVAKIEAAIRSATRTYRAATSQLSPP